MSENASKIEQLEKIIHHHNKKYFIDNDPEISDVEFDELTQRLKKLKPESPVLYELVGEIGDVVHPKPMLSIDKKYSYDDVKKWIEDVGDTNFIVEPKYDGMAARYQGGVLSTRGDGNKGEDISLRLDKLNIIGTLPKDNNVSAFGEVIIPVSYFESHLKDAYKNSRNGVVGIVKSKNVKPEGIKALMDGGVHFVIYDQVKSKTLTKDKLLNEDEWESILEETLQTDYPLDGIVIKVADTKIREELGSTGHHDKWVIAYKLPAERKWSTVTEIKDQVGRTGRVTSVAVIKPVDLSGATVTNITLHNFEFVKSSKIGIGSKVEVTRSGEVIPFITKVEQANKPYKLPTECPVCKNKLKINGKYLECVNPDCPARRALSFEYFFKTLDVEELGLKTIERFINEFKLENIINFYDLKESQIAPLDGFGEKSAKNVVTNIHATMEENITASQLLQALGIKEIGPATSKWIIDHYGFDKIPSLTEEDLLNVDGMGPVKAKHFVENIKEKWWIVTELQKRGLKLKRLQKNNKLNSMSFCITGTLDKYTRDELKDLIELNGGEYKASITKDLTYLIAGENAGSKLEKARENGVKILTEKEFILMINA